MKNFNRTKFLREVIANFINKSPERLKSAYSGYITALNNNNNAENRQINEEKRKILEKCLNIFSSVEFREKIQSIRDEQKTTPAQLVSAVTVVLTEKILGDQKRRYNMSNRYSDKIVVPNSARYTPSKITDENTATITKKDKSGSIIKIQHLGILIYSIASVDNESINKYRITKTLTNGQTQTYEIYSNIMLDKLDYDAEYCDAVLNELLSTNNIELSNSNGYVGQIENTSSYEKQIQIGEEIDDNPEFYRYQVSKNHALLFDSQDLSAVVDFEKQKEKQNEISLD